ncbi:MAG: arylsulfate sulfotransferase [Sulfurimonas sp.]|jgi:arylsulfate sulfotransferase
MKSRKVICSALVAGLIMALTPSAVMAVGGPSGPKVDYIKNNPKAGLGHIMMNPYGYAPLTAIITNNGYELKDVHVKIVPKKGGQVIEYDVADAKVMQHGGIPVFGLYADYRNTVEVTFTKVTGSKKEVKREKKTATYSFYAPPMEQDSTGRKGPNLLPFTHVKITKVDPEFKDRLYFVNNVQGKTAHSAKVTWNNPSGGALEWTLDSNAFIVDTHGEIRWYLDHEKLLDRDSIYNNGVMMGFQQNNDGAMSWGYGQMYVKFNIMGEKMFQRRLPRAYNDFSHSLDALDNGNYLMRVASSNHKRLDGKNVRTVRDVIAEVDKDGNVKDEWNLFNILDPYRSVVLKALDQGAVCLNIDASQAGHTLSAKDLAKIDASDHFGDIVGSGAGRNWAHVNSVDYDKVDDSIVISVRHQSAIIKVGRDKKVKWILGAHKGWKGDFRDKLLTPVDAKGNKIVCTDDMTMCPGYTDQSKDGFDWAWTQHSAYIIDSKTDKDVMYITAFDNGDARGNEQPAMAGDKYSRAVVYKVDQNKMTVQQVWEYGKDRGIKWFSPVTSLTRYEKDKDSVMVYTATAGMQFDLQTNRPVGMPDPEIDEFKWGSKVPSVQMKFFGTGPGGYQAFPFSVNKAFNQ